MNTCTSDNILTILLLHCQQNHKFLNTIGDSEIEKTLKAGIALMLSGKMYEGKTIILKFVQSQLNFDYSENMFNCYGNEFNKFLCLLRHVWKIYICQCCTSPHCPSKGRIHTRNPSEFNFYSPQSYDSQISEIFPETNAVLIGYCGSEFKNDLPPSDCPHGLNNHIVIDEFNEETQQTYYECRGAPLVVEASFINSNPWMIPINVANLSASSLVYLPKVIVVYGKEYQLGGFSMYRPPKSLIIFDQF